MSELRLAWRNVGRNPRRTALTVAATVFAVLLVVDFTALTRGVHEKMIEDSVRLRSGHAMLAAPGYLAERSLDHFLELDSAMIARLDAVPEVEGWAPRVVGFALVSQDVTSQGVALLGVDPRRESSVTSLPSRVVDGRFLSADAERGAREIVLGKRLAERIGARVGDRVLVYGVAYTLESAYELFTVVGLAQLPDARLERTLAVVAMADLQDFLAFGDRVSEVALLARSADRTEPLRQALVSSLDGLVPAPMVHPWPEVMPDLEQILILDDAGLYIMLAILVVVVGFGILNTILMAVLERQRELGVMLALGLRPSAIFRVVFLESILLAGLGLVLGLGLAIPIGLWMEAHPIVMGEQLAGLSEFMGMEPVITSNLAFSTVWKSALVILVVATVASLYPALKAGRANPVDALRSL
ncbi:MAG: ABC transporter permease [Myxococcota bacterium]|nr:ABC transporter permease [Myxococcota bacterium]